MRKSHSAILMLMLLSWPALGRAQDPSFTKVQVGFRPVGESDATQGAFKPFFWTPVWIELTGGGRPERSEVVIAAEDADGVATVTKYPVDLNPSETTKVLGYVKTSLGTQRGTPIDVSLRIGDKVIRPKEPLPALGLPANKRLCVTVGPGIPALEQVIALARDEKEARPDQALREFQSWRLAAIESIKDMPDRWYGYEGADVVILRTRGEHSDGFGPLADWVRRGGRLIMLVSDVVAKHDPSRPLVNGIPVKIAALDRSADNSVQEWGLASLFPGPVTASETPRPADSSDDWVRYAATKSTEPIPLVTRRAYGFGSVTYIGLPLDQIPVTAKSGARPEASTFFRILLSRVAGTGTRLEGESDSKSRPFVVQLNDELDRFDVHSLSFGWIAVSILLFLALVGPFEYFVLRKVRLPALTWLTYPAAITAVCLAAFLIAPRYKGHTLRLNQMDLVDVDLTSASPAKKERGKPRFLHVGRAHLTLFTPDASNLTLGIESDSGFLAPVKEATESRTDVVGWMGRADADYRVATAGLFRQPYTMDADGAGMADVNMSVWGTKNISAQWHAIMGPPIEHALTYPGRKAEESRVRLRGTLTNRLPVDLCDVWVLYDKVAFPVEGGLPRGEKVALSLGLGQGAHGIAAWTELPDPTADSTVAGERPETTALFKSLYFHELRQTRGDAASLFRPLDWSWRIRPAPSATEKGRREAIVIARAHSVRGDIEDIYARNQTPTRLWLGKLPGKSAWPKDRPRLEGQLTQATYFRFLVPVESEDK